MSSIQFVAEKCTSFTIGVNAPFSTNAPVLILLQSTAKLDLLTHIE